MLFSNSQQGSEEWLAERIGRFTSSEIHRLMADVSRPMTEQELRDPGRSGNKTTVIDPALLSDGAMTYVYEKVAEMETGRPAKKDVSTSATEWGKEWEPYARRWYERVYKVKVEQVGNLIIDEHTSGSPDGLIGGAGGIEIKCPEVDANQIKNLLIMNAIELKQEHKEWYWQIQDLLYLSGRQWWDWLSYHPLFEGKKKMHVLRLYRNKFDIENIRIKRAAATEKKMEILEYINL